jgi:hypothetical protein
MAAVFGVACFLAIFWSAIRYQFAYNSVVDSLPPQFQDDLTSRYAFPVYVLERSTPLHVQAEYMKSLWGSCVAALCASLCVFCTKILCSAALSSLDLPGRCFQRPRPGELIGTIAIESSIKTVRSNYDKGDL